LTCLFIFVFGFCAENKFFFFFFFPDNLREPDVTIDSFKRLLKTFYFCFQRTSAIAISTLDVLRRCALQIYISLTYLLQQPH